jgi:hypothetical protein
MRLWFLKFCKSLLLTKSKAKFLFASLKTLIKFKNPTSNLVQKLVAAFRNPPFTVKLAPEPDCDSKNCSVNRPLHVYLGRLFPCPIRGDPMEKTDQ